MKADHLEALGTEWHVWKWIRVRGAGLPARLLRPLTASRSAQALDALRVAEEACGRELQSAIAALALRISESEGEERKRLVALSRRLRRSKLPKDNSADDGLIALMQAQETCEDARAALAHAFEEDSALCSETLKEVACAPLFREAVAWQNLAALETGVVRVAKGGSGKKHRRAEQMIASYLQRYCLKNDTIGFFGPQGSGEFSASGPWKYEAGPTLLRKRQVFFEHWAIAALADRISKDPALRLHARPALLGSMRLDGRSLHHSGGQCATLPADFAQVLNACDGRSSAQQISATLAAELDDEDVFDILEELENRKIITWSYLIPTSSGEPERELRAELASIPEDVAARPLADLERLVSARDAVAQCAGRVDELVPALRELNRCFEELTEEEATRSAGEMYAGRTVVYEECRRDCQTEVGAQARSDLAPPLALLLSSARWFCYEVAERFRSTFLAEFRALRGESETIDYLTFWRAIRGHFGSADSMSEVTAEVQAELRRRWSQLLKLEEGQSRVHFRAADLEEAVKASFAAPGPGWPSARYHSPDIMVVHPEQPERTHYVLGEIHAAVNTCGIRVFQSQHDTPEKLSAARKSDLPEPAIVPVIARELASRADHVWAVESDLALLLGATPSARPQTQVLRIADLVVEEQDAKLCVRDRRSGRSFALTQVLESSFSAEVSADFTYLPAMSHRPRITIDKVVIGRETWRFSPEELASFTDCPRGLAQFEAARRWSLERNLPDKIFVKIPEETKPVYIDLLSPIYIEIFARLARKASHLSVSEMLPGPEALWLADAQGDRYTAELRFVALDPLPWRTC